MVMVVANFFGPPCIC